MLVRLFEQDTSVAVHLSREQALSEQADPVGSQKRPFGGYTNNKAAVCPETLMLT